MGDNDRRANEVQQFGEPRPLERMHLAGVGEQRPGRAERLVVDRVAGLASTGPLRVQVGGRIAVGALGRGDEDRAQEFEAELRAHRAQDVRVMRRPAVAGPVDDEHRVTLLDEQPGPAATAVRGNGVVDRLAAAPVHQHPRRAGLRVGRSLPFHEHGTAHDRAQRARDGLDPHPEGTAPRGRDLGGGNDVLHRWFHERPLLLRAASVLRGGHRSSSAGSHRPAPPDGRSELVVVAPPSTDTTSPVM